MRSKEGQNYPTQRVPGDSEVVLGQATAEDPQALSEILTEDGALAIDGGKLPGNHDDFQGEIDQNPKPVPGAHGREDHHEPTDLLSNNG